MSTLKVNEMRHLSNTGTANVVLESNATTNLQATSTLGLTVNGTLTVTGVATFNGNMVVGNASTDTVTLTSTVSGSANYSGFTGEIRMYAGNAAGDSPPAGWLYCNGDTINQTSGTSPDHHNSDGTGNDYQPLYNLLKASADWGNTGSLTWGTNNVKVPDFRSRAPVGVHTGASSSIGTYHDGNTNQSLTTMTLSDTSGAEKHKLLEAELAAHQHVSVAAASLTGQTASHAHTHGVPGVTTNSQNTSTTGTDGSHNHTLYHSLDSGSEQEAGLGAGWSGSWGQSYTSSQNINTAGSHSHSYGHTHTTPSTTTNSISTSTVTMGSETHTHAMTNPTVGSSTPHAIVQPIVAVHYIIKV